MEKELVDKREKKIKEYNDLCFKEAVRYTIISGWVSISMLQRRLCIGFTRAGNILQQMEKKGFVSPPDGYGKREIFITKQRFEKEFGEDLFANVDSARTNVKLNEKQTADDPLLKDAVRYSITINHASTTSLQEVLAVGYSRAGRIVDQMEERGYITPLRGYRAREVLIDKKQYRKIFGERFTKFKIIKKVEVKEKDKKNKKEKKKKNKR